MRQRSSLVARALAFLAALMLPLTFLAAPAASAATLAHVVIDGTIRAPATTHTDVFYAYAIITQMAIIGPNGGLMYTSPRPSVQLLGGLYPMPADIAQGAYNAYYLDNLDLFVPVDFQLATSSASVGTDGSAGARFRYPAAGQEMDFGYSALCQGCGLPAIQAYFPKNAAVAKLMAKYQYEKAPMPKGATLLAHALGSHGAIWRVPAKHGTDFSIGAWMKLGGLYSFASADLLVPGPLSRYSKKTVRGWLQELTVAGTGLTDSMALSIATEESP